MYPYLGDFPAGKTIFFPFHTFASTGASVTLTGLATTDIEVYKGASMTQRASDAGYALVDTDGIDLDGVTGIHGFTIDTSDNTDAGFYAAENDYTVIVSAVTVDSQTVNFIAGRFSIDNRGILRPTTATRTLDVTATGAAGIDWGNVENPTTALNLSGTNIDTDQVVASVSGAVGSVTGAVGSVTGNVGGNVTGSVGSVAAGGITSTSFANDAITAAKVAADVSAEIADAVWDEALAGHAGAGSAGEALSAAGTAGDPWTTALPGAYGAGTAGSLLGALTTGNLGIVDSGTAQSATGTTLVLRAAAGFANDEIIGATIVITGGTGIGQARIITDYVGSTDTATVDTWTTTPSGTITYVVIGTPPASATSVPAVNVTQWLGTAVATPTTAGVPEVDVTHCSGSAQATIATQASVNTIDDFLDTEVAAILAAVDTEVGAILADTNELQTDWANGGRLDLLLDGAASAGDPWTTSLPGAYGAGTAGYIVGTNLNAPVGTIDTVVDAIKVKTDYLPSATAGAAGGVFIAGSNAATTVNITGNVTGNLSGSVGSVTGAVGSVTGNVGGNVAGSVGSVTGAVGSVTGLTAADVGAIKAKTDSLTFTVAGVVDANIQRVNDVAITGDGSATPFNVV